MTPDEIEGVVAEHGRWLANEPSGCRANLSYANLSGADLRGANLRAANLSGAKVGLDNLDRLLDALGVIWEAGA